MGLLEGINGIEDVKRLPRERLPELCDEIRQRLIDVVSTTGGHIGAGLGVVELATAIAYVFDSPRDKIVWDVGHQAYPWKLLTGRNAPPEIMEAADYVTEMKLVKHPYEQGIQAQAGIDQI